MTPTRTNPEVDAYLSNATRWREELERLRLILLDSELTEEIKWRAPCYTLQGKNIAILQGFNDFCALMFFEGAVLTDPNGILRRPGENSRAARRAQFTSVREVDEMEPALRAYIREAIEAQRSGLKVNLEEDAELVIPDELQQKFDQMPDLKAAFGALTPGRQRAYILHFSAPKQVKTREARIERSVQKILAGKGPNDR